VKALHELGLVRKRDSGRTKIITTTERFSEYFGISTTDREEIKKWMIEKLNLQVPLPKEKKDKVEESDNSSEPDEPTEDAGNDESSPDSVDPEDRSGENDEINMIDEESTTSQSS
jgi:hypothetical protein